MPGSSSATAVEEGGTCCGDSHSPGHSRWLPAAWRGNALMSSPPGLWLPGPDNFFWRGILPCACMVRAGTSQQLLIAQHIADMAEAGCETGPHTSADGLSESSMTPCSESGPGCLALLHISHCCIATSLRKVQRSHCHASCLLLSALPAILAWSVPCAVGPDAVRALAAFRRTLHA